MHHIHSNENVALEYDRWYYCAESSEGQPLASTTPCNDKLYTPLILRSSIARRLLFVSFHFHFQYFLCLLLLSLFVCLYFYVGSITFIVFFFFVTKTMCVCQRTLLCVCTRFGICTDKTSAVVHSHPVCMQWDDMKDTNMRDEKSPCAEYRDIERKNAAQYLIWPDIVNVPWSQYDRNFCEIRACDERVGDWILVQ